MYSSRAVYVNQLLKNLFSIKCLACKYLDFLFVEIGMQYVNNIMIKFKINCIHQISTDVEKPSLLKLISPVNKKTHSITACIS